VSSHGATRKGKVKVVAFRTEFIKGESTDKQRHTEERFGSNREKSYRETAQSPQKGDIKRGQSKESPFEEEFYCEEAGKGPNVARSGGFGTQRKYRTEKNHGLLSAVAS